MPANVMTLPRWALIGFLLFAGPARAAWDRFEIIEWQKRDAPRLAALRKIGVTAAALIANRDGTGTPLVQQTAAPRQAGLRWYIENIATDFYAPYHKFTPGKDVNWLFTEAQARYRANPGNDTALFRDPPLLDPAWRTRIARRLTDTVAEQKSAHPLYYSLGDETGIADLSAYWDFDLSPVSLAGFQTWLHGEYGSLAALNREWGTSYASWTTVRPELTRAAMRRADDNFAAWNDFKSWMDTAFAASLRFGTDAIHRADPKALSGIEGAQMPGWGGYDYTKLATAVDLMEVYDSGENLPILRALNPRLIPLATSFAGTPAEMHRIWRAVLRGARGLILWDEDDSIVRPDASPGPWAAAYAPLFAAMRGDIGDRMVAAAPVYDDIALLYSPVGFRVRWMLDHRAAGDAWMNRSAEIENEDNAWRAAMRDDMATLSQIGLRPHIVTPEQLSRAAPRVSVLILPHAIALSDAEAHVIESFIAHGGRVIADVPPGQFDGHGRGRRAPLRLTADIVAPADLGSVLKARPMFSVSNDADMFLFRSRGHLLLAVQRRAPGETSQPVTIDLKGRHARDIATGHAVAADGRVVLDRITPLFLQIDP